MDYTKRGKTHRYLLEDNGRIWAESTHVVRDLHAPQFPYLVYYLNQYLRYPNVWENSGWMTFFFTSYYLDLLSEKNILCHPRPGKRGGVVISRLVTLSLEEALSTVKVLSEEFANQKYSVANRRLTWAVQHMPDKKKIILG